MVLALLLFGILAAALVWLNAEYYFNRSPEWSRYKLYSFWKRTTLIDGSAIRFGPCMRRYVNGAYQYRRENDAEGTMRETDSWI
jgi:hypothetical protein